MQFQTENKYKKQMYGMNTVYNSACGPASLCNALEYLGIAHVPLLEMCRFAENCDARVDGGTLMPVLLKSACTSWGFDYKTTNRNADLLAHLRAGGVAIINQGGKYPVFSNGGHYVCAVGVSGNTVTVQDSFWTDSKYKSWPRYHATRTGQKGVVTVHISEIGKATDDRSPCYYLISHRKKKVDDEMVTKEKYNVDGKSCELDTIVKDGVRYVAVRQLAAQQGTVVDYDSATNTASISVDSIPVVWNGVDIPCRGMGTAAGNTYVHIRDLMSLGMGEPVQYDPETKKRIIDTQGRVKC